MVKPELIELVNKRIRKWFKVNKLSDYFRGFDETSYQFSFFAEADNTGQVLMVIVHLKDTRIQNYVKMNMKLLDEEISKIKSETHYYIKFEKEFLGNNLIIKFNVEYSLRNQIHQIRK
jgi:hypothetical protein